MGETKRVGVGVCWDEIRSTVKGVRIVAVEILVVSMRPGGVIYAETLMRFLANVVGIVRIGSVRIKIAFCRCMRLLAILLTVIESAAVAIFLILLLGWGRERPLRRRSYRACRIGRKHFSVAILLSIPRTCTFRGRYC